MNAHEGQFEKWEEALFKKTLEDLSERVSSFFLSEYQFDLILKEAHVKFLSLQEQIKFRSLFAEKELFSKQSLIKSLKLCKTAVLNNKRYFIVKMKKGEQFQKHNRNKCFEWWKQFMRERYGADLRWFDAISRQKDCMRMKAFDFKQNIARVIKSTQHLQCADLIASFFPKNRHNEIEFGIFLSTIKVTSRRHLGSSQLKAKSTKGSTVSVSSFSQPNFFTENKDIDKLKTEPVQILSASSVGFYSIPRREVTYSRIIERSKDKLTYTSLCLKPERISLDVKPTGGNRIKQSELDPSALIRRRRPQTVGVSNVSLI